MPEEDKQDGHIEPAHQPGSLKPGAEPFDSSASGRFIIRTDTGEVADNPLNIKDPVKHDQSAMYTRKVIIWATCVMLLCLVSASIYGQLICTPPRQFDPPILLMAMIAGVFFGLSVNLIEKIVETLETWRRGK
jgi:Na+/glutamate symporter